MQSKKFLEDTHRDKKIDKVSGLTEQNHYVPANLLILQYSL